ncbi:MAG: anthranilate synthase component I family protein [Parvularculaceae bacterium]
MIWREVPFVQPRDVLMAQAGVAQTHLLCGGGKATQGWGSDWDLLVSAPRRVITIENGNMRVCNGPPQPVTHKSWQSTLAASLNNLPRDLALPDGLTPPVFVSGLVGMIGYELATLFEPTLELPPSPSALPDMVFGDYAGVAAFHRRSQRCFVFGEDEAFVAHLVGVVASGQGDGEDAARLLPGAVRLKASKSPRAYKKSVQQVIDYILNGDIFQANLAQRLTGKLRSKKNWQRVAANLFCKMTEPSHASFGACLQFEQGTILSNSPERYFNLRHEQDGLRVMAEPVKGTRPRLDDPIADKNIARDLVENEKDRAENIMIADLVRNDLSRVCRDHSISEDKICELRSYTYVHHLVSQISGTLREGLSALDVLATSFPCGSITGAPKIGAMEIIAELEGEGRGIYCGAIGFIDRSGAAEFSIPIRTATMEPLSRGALLRYGCGGGITILSDPSAEHQESLDKAVGFARLFEDRSS